MLLLLLLAFVIARADLRDDVIECIERPGLWVWRVMTFELCLRISCDGYDALRVCYAALAVEECLDFVL